MDTIDTQLKVFSDRLSAIEDHLQRGQLAEAFDRLEEWRKSLYTLISATYEKTHSTTSLKQHMKLVERSDGLKRNILKDMARKL